MLSDIKLPQDLKTLTANDLDLLAGDIRSLIIQTVSKNGGHLASNLGSVEIAIALHTIFNSPKDKIVWDVGHQAYAHKILTGRAEKFGTLRQHGGISGYPSIDESDHDPFTTGHASAAMASAMGLAKARDILEQDHKVIAVVGDGALSGGMSFEAINNAMNLHSNLIVVFNDNEMSISKNVGALAEYFTKVRMNPLYNTTKVRVENMVKKIPRLGMPLFHMAEKVKNRLKNFIIDFQTEVIVEELGLQYLGPIDGHNIILLMSALSFAKEVKRPIMVHVLTKKGKGYAPAESDPTKYHGATPFDITTGLPENANSGESYSDIFGQVISELGETRKDLYTVTAAMLEGTGLEEFSTKHPDRFYDVGIAEEYAVVYAAGMAKGGLKPVCAIYSTFLQRAYDQIFHDVCLQNLGVVFAVDRAGIVGDDGPTHNGVYDIAYLRHLPNMTLMAPKDENELRNMLFTAISHNGPVAIRYPRTKVVGVEREKQYQRFEIGKGEIVYKTSRLQKESGSKKKLLISALGSMVYPSIEAAKKLEKDVDVCVINARFVKPLDKTLICSESKNADYIITVEEGCLQGGFGSAVLEVLEEENIAKPAHRIGLPDKFIEAGKRDFILNKYGLDAVGIEKTIRSFLQRP